MNSAFKTALTNSNPNRLSFTIRLFHSTTPLERKRRNYYEARINNYSRRFRRTHLKQTLIRDANAYAEFMFNYQNWKEDIDEDGPSPNRGTSWFDKQYSPKDFGKRRNGSKGPQNYSRTFSGYPEFCQNDMDVENVLRSAFGGKGFFWSFLNEEDPQWRKRSEGFSNNYGKSWKWRHQTDNGFGFSSDSESDSESVCSHSYSVSDRLALGLSASGPLKLEDVKIAYRACALKWHPDRHQGSSKVVAEEKFKHCSAAYQSLCDKLALN